jgi:hypothetical protein
MKANKPLKPRSRPSACGASKAHSGAARGTERAGRPRHSYSSSAKPAPTQAKNRIDPIRAELRRQARETGSDSLPFKPEGPEGAGLDGDREIARAHGSGGGMRRAGCVKSAAKEGTCRDVADTARAWASSSRSAPPIAASFLARSELVGKHPDRVRRVRDLEDEGGERHGHVVGPSRPRRLGKAPWNFLKPATSSNVPLTDGRYTFDGGVEALKRRTLKLPCLFNAILDTPGLRDAGPVD